MKSRSEMISAISYSSLTEEQKAMLGEQMKDNYVNGEIDKYLNTLNETDLINLYGQLFGDVEEIVQDEW